MNKRLVILESPYGGSIAENVEYARKCVRDCLFRGEAPIASHLLYTQRGILEDDIIEDRRLGINAGLAWLKVADASVVYVDLGVSAGMLEGIFMAQGRGVPIEFRRVEDD